MDIKQEIITMLQLLPQPAFLVKDGVVTHTNAAAGVFLVQPGTPIMQYLPDGDAEYAAFTGDSLYLALNLQGKYVGATVTNMENCQLFLPEEAGQQAQLQAMALAAQQLREPLSAMLAASARFLPDAAAKHQQAVAQFDRRAHQLLRRINNMSDAVHFAQPESGWMEYMEICSFLEEILEKAATFAQSGGHTIRYQLPKDPLFTIADRNKLERALLNLLSNAIKFGSEGEPVLVQLIQKEKRLCLSVTGSGQRLDGDIYSRFLRQPVLEDPRNGIGLGMALVRATALAHGGAVLTDRPDETHNRVTLRLPIRRPEGNSLRSPVVHLDYAGGRDRCLLELSDVLLTEHYGEEY